MVQVNPNLLTGAANHLESWTQYAATFSGLSGPSDGRFGFRHFVADEGSPGTNSHYIGVDSVEFVTVHEPALGLILAGLGLGSCLIRRRVG